MKHNGPEKNDDDQTNETKTFPVHIFSSLPSRGLEQHVHLWI
jgi:hypothetical protein